MLHVDISDFTHEHDQMGEGIQHDNRNIAREMIRVVMEENINFRELKNGIN